MATSKSYSKSVVIASDEVKDIFCEPCVDDGKQIEAEGFCVDCSEYLCGQCYKNHTRNKAFKHHVLQDQNKMPLNAPRAAAKDTCEEKCTIHPKKVIEYFCRSCDALGCSACITLNHRQCKDVDHIPDIVNDLEKREEFKEFVMNLDKKLNAVSERKIKLNSYANERDEMQKKAKVELQKQRNEINKFFDKLEAKLDRRIEDIDENNKKKLKSAGSTCDSILDNFKHMKTTVDTKQRNGQNCELFIAMKNFTSRMEEVENQLEKLRKKCMLQRYALTSSRQIREVIKNTTGICRLRMAKFLTDLCVGTDNDKEKSMIRGLAMVQNHYIALLDSKNKSVKLFDTRNMKMSSEMILKCDFVWGITNVNDDQVAVCITSGIQLFSVSTAGSLSKRNLFELDSTPCGSLCYTCENIYAIGYKEVLIIDLKGNIKNIISVEYSKGIAVSPDNKTIYLTNPVKHSVTSMTLDGKVNAIYKDKDLESPYGITVDNEGLVYVSSLYTSSIHQLSEDCSKIQVLLDHVYAPCITYSNAENRLYFGCGDTIKVYQLE